MPCIAAYPAITNCGNSREIALEGVGLSFVMLDSIQSQLERGTGVVTSVIDRHLNDVTEFNTLKDLADFCLGVDTIDVAERRPITVSQEVYRKLLAISYLTTYPVREVAELLINSCPPILPSPSNL